MGRSESVDYLSLKCVIALQPNDSHGTHFSFARLIHKQYCSSALPRYTPFSRDVLVVELAFTTLRQILQSLVNADSITHASNDDENSLSIASRMHILHTA